MTAEMWGVVFFTMRASLLATLLLIPPGIATAWLLSRPRLRGKALIETIVSLPLFMPPVATGLILLRLLSRDAPAGRLLAGMGLEIIFTSRAVVLAMMVMSFPLFVRAARSAFEAVDARVENVARTLGASDWRVFLTMTLPLGLPGIIAGSILAFARALGEFGATVLVAGIIPGRTTTISTSIFNSVQLGDDHTALALVGVATVIAFAALLASELLLRRSR